MVPTSRFRRLNDLFIRRTLEVETVRTLVPSISEEVLKRLEHNLQRQHNARDRACLLVLRAEITVGETVEEHTRIVGALKSRDGQRTAQVVRQQLDAVATERHRLPAGKASPLR